MSAFPVVLLRGDSLDIETPAQRVKFTVGETVEFKSAADIEDFLNNSQMIEWETTHYPFLFGIFGGEIEVRRHQGLVRRAP